MDSSKPVIFLSASMPTKDRDHRFFDTADFIAIRDAIVALVNAIIPNYRLVWGGHPAITPIIHDIFKKRGFDYNEHITIYQSNYFLGKMPKENQQFDNVVLTDEVRSYADEKKNIAESLAIMRERMMTDNPIYAGVFIGGMEGVLDEYELLKQYSNGQSKIFPIASTGAAARILYNELTDKCEIRNTRLLTDYCYATLFNDLLN